MSQIAYKDFVAYRQKLTLAADDIAQGKNSAASNRIRAVKKHLENLEESRTTLNCESLGRLNFLQKTLKSLENHK